jgi:hypothetical protein
MSRFGRHRPFGFKPAIADVVEPQSVGFRADGEPYMEKTRCQQEQNQAEK